MNHEVSYEQVMTVTASWDKVKQIPDYVPIIGELLFVR